MKQANGLEQVKEMFERRKANDQNDIPKKDLLNNSTLSLHIVAYENSADISADAYNEEKDGSKMDSSKSKKARQIITGSTSLVQNAFEFPGQQENDKVAQPEMMHGTALF
uniref:Uncharacterized protein n=1 Tax=Panagrolaimus sp. ES5 TaxID=591445 RepID=A0AC34FZJ9_9BILA